MRILLLAEKPSLARLAASHVLDKHRWEDGDASITTVFCLPYDILDASFDIAPPWGRLSKKLRERTFRYPHDIRWGQVPTIMKPRYRDISTEEGAIGISWWDGLPLGPGETVLSSDARLRSGNWDVIYGAFDTSSTGMHGFDATLRLFLGDDLHPDVRWIPWETFTEDGAKKAVTNPDAWYDVREKGVTHSLVKRHFVYNYAVNAHVVFGRALREATGLAGGDSTFMRSIASRTALQCLYMFRDVEGLEDGDAIDRMRRWKGTGRYDISRLPRSSVFGSSSNRAETIENLIRLELLYRDGRLIRISEKGERYLSLLHPDCHDPDQDFRLALWRTLPFDEAIPKVDRYIRTFFGKQKRFAGRQDKLSIRAPQSP